MANQKRQTQPLISFFDEMQDKMRTETIKRRKIAQTNQSKPELLFLQFKPSGKEDFNSFSNKCKSHAFESNKRPWKPPIKVHSEFELNQLSPEEKSAEINKSHIEKDNFNLLKKSCRDETKNLTITTGTTSDFSKTLDDTTINEKEPINMSDYESGNLISGSWIQKNLSSEEHPENNIAYLLHTPCSSQMNKLFNNSVDVDVEALTQPNVKVTARVSNDDFCHDNVFKGDNLSVIIISNTKDEMEEEKMDSHNSSQAAQVGKSQEIKYCEEYMDKDLDSAYVHNKENVQQNNSDSNDKNLNSENNINKDFDLAFVHNKENVNPNDSYSNNNNPKNSEHMDKNFDLAFVHGRENFQHNNFDCNDNARSSPNEIGEANDSVKLIQKDKHENSYGENQDIINSIDMILSEGQNCNSDKAEDNNEEEMRNEKEEGEEILVDSVFQNSGPHSPENNNVESRTPREKQSVVEELNPPIYSSENKQNSELGNDLTPEVISEGPQSVVAEKSKFLYVDTPKKEVSSSLNGEDSSKIIEDIAITPCKTTVYSENNNNVCKSAQRMQSESALQADDNKGLIEDDYSCLMISHSQLLEIEQQYYEAPQKANVSNTPTPIKSPDLREVNKQPTISVSTQTDKFQWLQCSHLNSLPQTPVVKWSKTLKESQKQLRETIQEINRLKTFPNHLQKSKTHQKIWKQF